MSKRSRKTVPYAARQPYEGRLNKKIVLKVQTSGEDSVLIPSEAALRKAGRLQIVKIKDLLKQFGISRTDPQRWQKLSVAIARNCVPGMQIVLEEVAKKSGRRKIWDRDHFIERVDKLMASGMGKKKALDKAAKELGSEAQIRSLQNQYSSGRIKWAVLSAEADDFLASEPELAKLFVL